MRSMVIVMVAGVMVLHCGVARAAKTWDDMSWWGNTGAKPEPKSDSIGRAGCWWLPVEAAKNDQDVELWGNRGVVFHAWKKPTPTESKPSPPKPVEPELIDYKPYPSIGLILFDFGKAVLRAEGKAEADKVVVELKKHRNDKVIVEGHASPEGDDAYNMALGLRRAESVKKYMVESGIEPNRITTKSYGETQPVLPNDIPARRKINRRVEFRVEIHEDPRPVRRK